MTFCPHCGEEVTEPVSYCPKCGELLDTELAERTSLVENIKYAVNAIIKNPYVFAPELVLMLASAIGGQLFSKLYGPDVYLDLQEAILAGGDLSPYYPLFKIAAGYMIVGMIFDLLFQPFIQYVYLDVAQGDSVDLGRSLRNTLGRLGEYVVAQLAVISIPVVILIGIFSILGTGPMDEVPSWFGGVFILILILGICMYFLTLGTQIMVWEGEKFTASIKLGLDFFQRKIGTLITLTLINIVVGLVFMYLPFNTYYGFILNVFNGVVTIDIYKNYRKMRK